MEEVMSKYRAEVATCPNCGEEHEVWVWSSVNVDLDPEQRARIIDSEFFVFTCPDCGNRAGFEYTFLYHDMKHGFMIYFISASSEEEFDRDLQNNEGFELELLGAKEGFAVFAERYRHRIVSSKYDLIEKISIFENSLDDRVIEVMKFFCMAKLDEDLGGRHITRMFFSEESGEYCFVVSLDDGDIGTIGFSTSLYDDIQAKMLPDLDKKTRKGFQVVDLDWALDAMNIGGNTSG
jgi:predicted RNA-binding Zn-ribbon protein involved in translation (DUF1610 family)